MAQTTLVKERAGGIYTNDVIIGQHHLYADEPESLGSADLGPTPFELVAAGLGACTTITLRMYVSRKKWDVENIACEVSHKMSRNSEGKEQHVYERAIIITGDVDQAQRERMMKIADKCPVHRMLTHEAQVRTRLK